MNIANSMCPTSSDTMISMNWVTTASGNGLFPALVPNHYLIHVALLINWSLKNKSQWNLNLNAVIFIQENSQQLFNMKASMHALNVNNDSEK